MTRFIRSGRLAVGVARLAGGAAIAVAMASTANAADSYGAIAYDSKGSWGRSQAFPTREAAETAAMKSCGSADCKVLITFTACGAVAAKDAAHDAAATTKEYQTGTGADLNAAMKDALAKLPGGYIDTWACN